MNNSFQRLLGRHEVPVYGDEVVHRIQVHRLGFSFKLSLVSVIFSLKRRSHQIFRHLRTELDRSNKAFLSLLFETSDPGVDDLVLVPVVDDVHPEMVGSRTDNPWPDGETEHKRHSSEGRDRCAEHEAWLVDASLDDSLDDSLSVVPKIGVGFAVARRRTDKTQPRAGDPLLYGTEGSLCRVAGGRRLDHLTDLLEGNSTDIDGLGFEVI